VLARRLLSLSQKNGSLIENVRAGQSEPAGQPGLGDTISMLRGRGLPVAIVETVPSFPVDVPNCAARARMFGRSDERCFSFPRRCIGQDWAQAASMLGEVSWRPPSARRPEIAFGLHLSLS